MEYVIILATAVAVLLPSWLAFRLLRRRNDFLTSCFVVSGFWLCIDFLLAGLLLWVLYSDFVLDNYPITTDVLQYMLIASFPCASFVFCYAGKREECERMKDL
jgi:hypothetical protein